MKSSIERSKYWVSAFTDVHVFTTTTITTTTDADAVNTRPWRSLFLLPLPRTPGLTSSLSSPAAPEHREAVKVSGQRNCCSSCSLGECRRNQIQRRAANTHPSRGSAWCDLRSFHMLVNHSFRPFSLRWASQRKHCPMKVKTHAASIQ